MENSIIEASYPITFREDDCRRLGEHLRLRHSVELIGMKRVGISNFLRFFLYHKDIVRTYINHGEKHLFIPVDLNGLVEREIFPFWILTFKRLVDKSETYSFLPKTKQKISDLFLSSIQSRDLFLTIENLREVLNLVVKEDIYPTLFFLRFDRLSEAINQELFANLQGLRDATHNKLSYVFTSFRTLDVIAPNVFTRKALSVFSHPMYIKPAQESDMKIVFETFEKRYNIAPSKDLLRTLLSLSGGHVQYMQICFLILNENLKSKRMAPDEFLITALSDERIILQSEEIWESLFSDEQAILKHIQEGKETTESDKNKAKYLFETGIVVEKNKSNTIFSSLFSHYLQQKMVEKNGDEIVEFSRNENRLFTLLLEAKGEICEREKIIQAVWPESEEFGVSDWTIDRLVARLRSKLKKQNSKYSVVTVKTRGYKLIE